MSSRPLLLVSICLVGAVFFMISRDHRAHHRRLRGDPSVHLDRLAEGARRYFDAAHLLPDGTPVRGRLPASAPRTPPGPLCDGNNPLAGPDPAHWQHPSWRALHFRLGSPHPYRYAFLSDARGFTARALGDLDCDGVAATFDRQGTIGQDGRLQISAISRSEDTPQALVEPR